MFKLFFLGVIVLFPQVTEAQLLSVSGYVKNYISGQPIENATIYESHSGIGTISDSSGYYKLLLQKGTQELKVSNVGFDEFKSTFALASDTIVSVNLKPRNFSQKNIVAGNKLDKDSLTEDTKTISVKKRK
ncbi:CarboxypepD_reg-like domain-containing protein [Mariniphaga anaerophila]|uniref:CarboxypepD_reg-like domain-containing protein n=2 Tax=Mariniphaga anaerophila TaxID=1484053 RepID=A0A1M4TQN3_9BACT|nr:CarboxypepD_reg-like domain-containing protein [Mariniphaga anaerophila]